MYKKCISTIHKKCSKIFRIITDESTGATKSIGLFGKSLSELKTAIASFKSQGLTNFIFNHSTIDETVISNYNAEIERATANGAIMEKNSIVALVRY